MANPLHIPSGRTAKSTAASLVAVVALLASCAGGDTYAVDETQIAREYLPTNRALEHHPDSLAHLAIRAEDGKIKLELDASYKALLRNWSCTWESRDLSSARGQGVYFQSFATLWSLELSLASLEPERGLQGLSSELARRTIAERKEEYRERLQIDVYRFLESPATRGELSVLRLDGAGRRVTLEDDQGNTYRPVRVEVGLPREAFGAEGASLYGRSALFFERVVDGRDMLEGVSRLRLIVRESAPSVEYYFTWTFPQAEAPASSENQ